MPNDLEQLDLDALQAVSNYFQAEARRAKVKARDRAESLKARAGNKKAIRTAQEEMDALARVVEGYIAAGRSRRQAILAAAALFGLKSDHVTYALVQWRKRKLALARFRRDREILRRAAKGWTDKRLSEAFGLSARSISKIIRNALDARQRENA